MSCKLNRAAYEQLIAEDLAALKALPDTLERHHIEHVLTHSVATYYDPRWNIEAKDAELASLRERLDAVTSALQRAEKRELAALADLDEATARAKQDRATAQYTSDMFASLQRDFDSLKIRTEYAEGRLGNPEADARRYREVIDMHQRKGHRDTCSAALAAEYPCDCGFEAGNAAIDAALAAQEPR